MHPHLLDVFSRLDRSRAALGTAVESIAAPRRQERPGPDRWSAAEVLEHLSMVERIFTGRIADAIAAARAGGLVHETDGRLPLADTIEARMSDRVNKRSAPDVARPTGTLDAAEAWQAVESGHQKLRTLVADADGLALSGVTLEHPAFGTMSVYQFVELMAAHEARHAEQIKEIARALAGGT
jgi:DinB family protein